MKVMDTPLSSDQPGEYQGQWLVPMTAVALLIGFWQVFEWFISRLSDGSDEPLGALALLSLALLIRLKRQKGLANSRFSSFYLTLSLTVLICYLASTYFLSPLPRAALAVAALAAFTSSVFIPLSLAQWCLALMSLPIIASLNFYLGFPLRAVVAKVSAALLALGGISARADGTLLNYQDKLVYVDAPCSGIKMLWFALFITFTLSSYLSLGRKATVLAAFLAFVASLFANALRVTSLFYIETGLLKLPQYDEAFLHQGSGLIVFAALLLFCIWFCNRLKPGGGETQTIVPDANSNSKNHSWQLLPIIALSIVSAILPLTPLTPQAMAESKSNFKTVTDKELREVLVREVSIDETQHLDSIKLENRLRGFLEDFPGEIRVLTDGRRLFIVRRIEKPTRKLHPASDCYRGAGFKIDYRPMEIDSRGRTWGHFIANKDGARISVRERICDGIGNQWTGPSSWYWNALTGETKPPWWGITVEEGGLSE